MQADCLFTFLYFFYSDATSTQISSNKNNFAIHQNKNIFMILMITFLKNNISKMSNAFKILFEKAKHFNSGDKTDEFRRIENLFCRGLCI